MKGLLKSLGYLKAKKAHVSVEQLMKNLAWPIEELFVIYSKRKKIQQWNTKIYVNSYACSLYFDRMTKCKPDAYLG